MGLSNLTNLEALQTYNHSQLLDVIDELRAKGLGRYLSLPQLIVCGDQSSGKSSVLEAISGVPFPKKDKLCTRFATEVILRRNNNNNETLATVSIQPGQSRSETDRQNLKNFTHSLSDIAKLPEAIQQAKEAMGLGSQGSNAFSTDVLRLEVTSPRMPQLTIVDLPGLIHSENKIQTAQDVELVSELVKSYMAQKRSIILAVVSAKNDHANQIVLTKAREEDPLGQRTLGIITKPDTLHSGSESETAFIELANNTDIAFELGWHVIRNLDTNEILQENQDRDSVEREFFQNSNWRSLSQSKLGIESLRKRLSLVLFEQIIRELPQLMNEIEVNKIRCETDLNRLGRSRNTEEEQRLYLAELNQKMYDVCRAGCDGNYDDAFFQSADVYSKQVNYRRFRAIVQNENKNFATTLEDKGSKWLIMDKSLETKNQISQSDAISRVMNLLQNSRGRELPGTFNPLLISELFHEYSQPWSNLAKNHVHHVWLQATKFLEEILYNFTDNSVCEMYFQIILQPEMDSMLQEADQKLVSLLSALRSHATTYNHDFTANVSKRKNERRKESIQKCLEDILSIHGRITQDEAPLFAEQLIKEPELDMDRVAAEVLFDNMQAYYEVIPRIFFGCYFIDRYSGCQRALY
jgi:GTPase SAR1 family protein